MEILRRRRAVGDADVALGTEREEALQPRTRVLGSLAFVAMGQQQREPRRLAPFRQPGDQFLIAGLAKWGETSRLTLLLPHGYEGQGPEHSSARLERFLALGAEGNIRVANCTTPAQYFHLLRRQALHTEIRPLVVMTPKSLLRLPAANSRLDDLVLGKFRTVLWDRDRSWPET